MHESFTTIDHIQLIYVAYNLRQTILLCIYMVLICVNTANMLTQSREHGTPPSR